MVSNRVFLTRERPSHHLVGHLAAQQRLVGQRIPRFVLLKRLVQSLDVHHHAVVQAIEINRPPQGLLFDLFEFGFSQGHEGVDRLVASPRQLVVFPGVIAVVPRSGRYFGTGKVQR